MPKRGPTPKENAQRRNVTGARNVKARQGGYPPLPGAEHYSGRTNTWYETWATSPQASLFVATDWQRLHMLAPLVEAYFNTPDRQTFAEIRQNEAKLGATPEDRERLRWKIEDDPDEEPEKPVASRSRDRKDPRQT